MLRLFVFWLTWIPLTQANEPLPHVMSTNLCADILLLSLADPKQIISISKLSQRATHSSFAFQAKRFPANSSSAEEVIAAHPELVLASRSWKGRHQAHLMTREGIQVIHVPFPKDWSGILDGTKHLGTALKRGDTANHLVANVKTRLEHLKAKTANKSISALYLRTNGGTAGSATHIDAVFRAAGLTNQQADSGRSGWGRLALEEVIARPPELIVSAPLVRDTAYARARFSRHPSLQALTKTVPVVQLTHNDWGCANWTLIQAAEELAAARQKSPPEQHP